MLDSAILNTLVILRLKMDVFSFYCQLEKIVIPESLCLVHLLVKKWVGPKKTLTVYTNCLQTPMIYCLY